MGMKTVPDKKNNNNKEGVRKNDDVLASTAAAAVASPSSASASSSPSSSVTNLCDNFKSISISEVTTTTTTTTTAAATAAKGADDQIEQEQEEDSIPGIKFVNYTDESQLNSVMALVGRDLSEPYSIFTYRYFLHQFPDLCILAVPDEESTVNTDHDRDNSPSSSSSSLPLEPIGCVVCKIDEEEQEQQQNEDGAAAGVAVVVVDDGDEVGQDNNHNMSVATLDTEGGNNDNGNGGGGPLENMKEYKTATAAAAAASKRVETSHKGKNLDNSMVEGNTISFVDSKEASTTGKPSCALSSSPTATTTAEQHPPSQPQLHDPTDKKEKVSSGYIAMLAVNTTHRRSGIGTELAKRAIRRMKHRGCQSVTLETEVSNTAAMHLYEDKLGFVREELLVRYYLNWGDAYRLRLWFD